MRVNLSGTELSSVLPALDTGARSGRADAKFAKLHADSLARLSGVGSAGSAADAPAAANAAARTSQPAEAESTPPKNETYKPIPGQPYEEIVSGRRNGMFINRSGNSRDGEAFVLVKRNGREFHIYGTGADRQVVPIAKGDKPSTTSATGGEQVIKGTTYRDVAGRAFDEIVSGPRNGMFVNRSGNSRDGKAFLLVERGDHELHIYGSGANRLVVRVVPPDVRKDGDGNPAAAKPAAAADEPNATPA